MRVVNILYPPRRSYISKNRASQRPTFPYCFARLLLACGLLLASIAHAADDAVPLSREEVQERWHSRMDGRHFVARVRMEVDLDGLHEERRITVHRDDENGTAERVMIRFDSPAALRNLGLLYFEQTDRPNDYFLYRPAVRRVRRLQERAVANNLYGVDPEFLGFGIAETEPTRIRSMKRVRLNGRETYQLEERARRSNPRFEERTVWIDSDTFIPMRTVHRLNGHTVLTAETLEIREVQGVQTPVRMHFRRPLDGTAVDLVVERIDYERQIPEEVFSVFSLTKSLRAQK